MKNLNDIKIRNKLIGSFLILAFITFIVALIGLVFLNSLAENGEELYTSHLIPVEDLGIIESNIYSIRANTYKSVFLPEEGDEILKRILISQSDIDSYLEDLSQIELTQSDKEALNDFTDSWILYKEELGKVIDLLEKKEYSKLPEIVKSGTSTSNARADLDDALSNLRISIKTQANDISTHQQEEASFCINMMLFLAFCSILFGIGMGIYLTRSITIPLYEVVDVAEKIGKGSCSARVGFSRRDEIGILGSALNKMGEHISAMVSDAKKLAQAAQIGDLSIRADPTPHEGDYQVIISDFNASLDAVIGPLNVAAEYVNRISKGDIPEMITDDYKGDFREIKDNLNTCIKAVHLLVEDTNNLTHAAVNGDLSLRADPTRHTGDFRKIIEGVNATLDALIGPLNVAAEYMDRIAKGDIPEKIRDDYKGDFREIKNNINTCINAIHLLVEDANNLTKGAVNGELTIRADPSRHTGDYKKIVQGVNATLDAVIGPLHEAMRVSSEFAEGNFTARLDDNIAVSGDFIEFKEALNRIGIELTRMLSIINEELFEGVNVLSAASAEILSVTSQLSSSTAETASSVNETSATVEEVRKTTEISNLKAKQVSEMSQKVSQVALKGQASVEEIISGMNHIQQQMDSIASNVVKLSEQSQAIGEIIATVTDIAEQSNLLAVNASIEAAKAGEYGRGFGVVALEIKTLADQSKQATTNIRTILTDIQRGISSTVISTEQGAKMVSSGVQLSSDAQEAIILLSNNISDAAKSSIQIAASSQEQVVGMDQIVMAMDNIRLAAQNNLEVTRQVEKTAKDLHDLGNNLKQITERFRI